MNKEEEEREHDLEEEPHLCRFDHLLKKTEKTIRYKPKRPEWEK